MKHTKWFSIDRQGKVIIPELDKKKTKKNSINQPIQSEISKLSYQEVYRKRESQQQDFESKYYYSSVNKKNITKSIVKINKPWLINNHSNHIVDDYIIIVPNDKVDEYLT